MGVSAGWSQPDVSHPRVSGDLKWASHRAQNKLPTVKDLSGGRSRAFRKFHVVFNGSVTIWLPISAKLRPFFPSVGPANVQVGSEAFSAELYGDTALGRRALFHDRQSTSWLSIKSALPLIQREKRKHSCLIARASYGRVFMRCEEL